MDHGHSNSSSCFEEGAESSAKDVGGSSATGDASGWTGTDFLDIGGRIGTL